MSVGCTSEVRFRYRTDGIFNGFNFFRPQSPVKLLREQIISDTDLCSQFCKFYKSIFFHYTLWKAQIEFKADERVII